MGTTLGPCPSSAHGAVSLLQEIAQINEDNLTAYNRCALFALGAAYLNLISQLTTVPTFCQHIHEVRRWGWGRGWSLVRGSSGIGFPGHPWGFELGSLLVFYRSSRCGRRKLPICSLKMSLWRDPGKSLENTFFPAPEGLASISSWAVMGLSALRLPVFVPFPIWGWHSGKDIEWFSACLESEEGPMQPGEGVATTACALNQPNARISSTGRSLPLPGSRMALDPVYHPAALPCHQFKGACCLLSIPRPRLAGLAHPCWPSLVTLGGHIWW